MSKTFEQLEPVISALDERIKTNLDAYPTDTAEGEIASFSDGADDVPVKSLVVGIEPVQDLHGQDSPYPAGAGKNLYNADGLSTHSTNGITATVTDGTITFNGTATARASFTINNTKYPNSSYTWSFNNPTVNNGVHAAFRNSSGTYFGDAPANAVNKTVTVTGEPNSIILYVAEGTTLTDFVIKPQFEEGSAATEWAPCSNICPITGWTGAKVSKKGVNLWDEEWVVGTVSSAGVPYVLDGKIRSKNYIPVKQGTTLYFKGPSTLRVAQYDASKTFISYTTVTNGTLTMTDKTCFVMFAMDKADETYDEDISINYPATDTAYHPYSGESVDISFPTEAGTVYGGTLDVTNGVLTVDKASMTVASAGLNGMANGMQIVSATPPNRAYGVDNVMSNLFATGTSGAYTVNGNTSSARVDFRIPLTDLGITESDSSSVRQDAVNVWMASHSTQLVYGVTPITYNLTPTEVKSLLGQNNVWADTGDTSVVYRADTSAYIAKKIAEAISALS